MARGGIKEEVLAVPWGGGGPIELMLPMGGGGIICTQGVGTYGGVRRSAKRFLA